VKDWPDSNSDNLNSSEMMAFAAAHDMDIFFPEPRQLFMDIDTVQQFETFTKNSEILMHKGKVEWKEYPSKTADGIHKHIVVETATEWDASSRILMQACLGSDPTRELLSYMRLLEKDPHPTMLARPKIKGEK
jgi:hypothetical protein